MSIVGYNIDPESGDASAGIEMNAFEEGEQVTATLYIDEVEIGLTYNEVCALADRALSVRRQMQWAMAFAAWGRDRMSSEKSHIIPLSDAMDQASALCGRKPHHSDYYVSKWMLDPFFQLQEECRSWMCKRCFDLWKKKAGK